MDHEEVGRHWNENSEAWTRLARAGYDVARDTLNTPAYLDVLPEVDGLSGLDVGCGEGHNTRLVAGRGARTVGIDTFENFVHHARAAEEAEPLGIRYERAGAAELPFEDARFDFVVAFMSLMDMPEVEGVLGEVFRVLRPGGFLQFSIEHPCFATPHRKTLRDEHGRAYAREVGGYCREEDGEVQEWIFSSVPPEIREGLRPFRVPRFTRPLSRWLNLLIDTGFLPERFGEPYPNDEAVRDHPGLQGARVFAYFFHARARKPATAPYSNPAPSSAGTAERP